MASESPVEPSCRLIPQCLLVIRNGSNSYIANRLNNSLTHENDDDNVGSEIRFDLKDSSTKNTQ
jgi:hypothetical protein